MIAPDEIAGRISDRAVAKASQRVDKTTGKPWYITAGEKSSGRTLESVDLNEIRIPMRGPRRPAPPKKPGGLKRGVRRAGIGAGIGAAGAAVTGVGLYSLGKKALMPKRRDESADEANYDFSLDEAGKYIAAGVAAAPVVGYLAGRQRGGKKGDIYRDTNYEVGRSIRKGHEQRYGIAEETRPPLPTERKLDIASTDPPLTARTAGAASGGATPTVQPKPSAASPAPPAAKSRRRLGSGRMLGIGLGTAAAAGLGALAHSRGQRDARKSAVKQGYEDEAKKRAAQTESEYDFSEELDSIAPYAALGLGAASGIAGGASMYLGRKYHKERMKSEKEQTNALRRIGRNTTSEIRKANRRKESMDEAGTRAQAAMTGGKKVGKFAKSAGKTLAIDAGLFYGISTAAQGGSKLVKKIRGKKPEQPQTQQESEYEFSEDRGQRARQVASFGNRSARGLAVDAGTFYGVGYASKAAEKGVQVARERVADQRGKERPSKENLFRTQDRLIHPGT